ncbi:CRTAC1 family protein [Aureliella helgolandensis]|uniref:CRTAC1 family protein n=1 Tax=Aureliella helgolandensis TaxID=2527968 RepID=UPI0018D0A03D|nr:CRTAC1 family protein [Aureliella helgolandensis]
MFSHERRGTWPEHMWSFLLVMALSMGPQQVNWAADRLNWTFSDFTSESGIDFVHEDGHTDQQYLYELMGAGVAVLDYDSDGRLDCLFCTGVEQLPHDGIKIHSLPLPLYRNLGERKFKSQGKPARLSLTAYGLGVATADYNNDGFEDVYLSNFGQNQLLQNNGDGTFSDVTEVAGVSGGAQFSAGVAFLDLENDGDLDLFVGNYVEFSYERHDVLAPLAFPFPLGPKDYPPAADQIFVNTGEGGFIDASASFGLSNLHAPTMGIVGIDFDQDGDTDIFACNDGRPNHLYENLQGMQFREAGLLAGVAYDLLGNANGSMGADVTDFNNDGIEDLLVSDYIRQLPMLYQSVGGLGFEDAARRSGIGRSVISHVNWGVAWGDFDLDGDADALLANGHFLREVVDGADVTSYAVANTVMENIGDQKFRDISRQVLNTEGGLGSSRGVAVGDLDGDGDLDAIILNNAAPPQMLENLCTAPAHWLQCKLTGVEANRNAVGARVVLQTSHKARSQTVHRGRGYQSDYGHYLHFAWPADEAFESVTVHWPGGTQQQVKEIALDQLNEIIEQPAGAPPPP